jgi:DNA-binding transcriptional LysR family regulator
MELLDRVAYRLKLRDLRLLDAVVRSKSMARAASELNVTQPAVSKAISELEHMLGVRLLDRNRQGIEPTPYGRALLKSGVAIFDDLRQGVREIEFLSDPTVGELRIGAIAPMIAGILPVVLARLNRRHPRIVFKVTQVPVGTRYAHQLRERHFDLFLGRLMGATKEDDLAAEILFDEPLFVAAGAHNRLAHRRKIDFAELVHEPWVAPQLDTIVGGFITEVFQAYGLDTPPTAIVCNSIEMQRELLTTGQFLTLFPRSLLRFGTKRTSIKVLPVELPVQPMTRLAPIGVVTLKNRTASPVAPLFLHTLREVAKSLASEK